MGEPTRKSSGKRKRKTWSEAQRENLAQQVQEMADLLSDINDRLDSFESQREALRAWLTKAGVDLDSDEASDIVDELDLTIPDPVDEFGSQLPDLVDQYFDPDEES